MAEPLTPRQIQILGVLRDSIKTNGFPPSIREIGDAVGLASGSSVAAQLTQLEDKGFIRRDPNKPRALVVLDPSEGDVAAVNADRGRIRDGINGRKGHCVVDSENCEYCAGLTEALHIVGGAS